MRKRIFCLMILLCYAFSGCQAVNSESRDDAAKLLCLNIGKADCMLLLYENSAYLIDTGYEQTWPALEAAFSQYGISRLNGVFLTHCHEDHMGGLTALAESKMEVDAWYAARIFYDQKESKHPMKLAAAKRNEEVTWLEAGAVIPVGSEAKLTVLGPVSVNTDNENNNSLVMRFDSPQGSILLAGDMKEEEEYELLDAGLLAPCDLLKAGHHGDNKATCKAFLQAVRPKAAVILTSSAEEPDTPASSTIRRLEKIGCKVYVSQEYHDALLFTLRGGEVSAEDIRWDSAPEREEHLHIAIDLAHDTLTVVNQGAAAVNLKDWAVYSTKGNELIYLPDIDLPAGGAFVIGSGETDIQADLIWRKKRVWNLTSPDRAVLYDAWGRPVAFADNGIGG